MFRKHALSYRTALSVTALLLCLGCADEPTLLKESSIYEGSPDCDCLTETDQKFLEAAKRYPGGPEKASEQAILAGWRSISSGNWKTAMAQFNQARLLTPENGDIYWGFASAMSIKGDLEESVRQFRKAVEMSPDSAPILCDFAHTYIRMGMRQSQERSDRHARIDDAIALLEKASRVDPNYELTYSNWALAHFHKNEYSSAWKMVARAEALGGRSLDPRFIDDLSAKMSRPAPEPH